MKTDNQISNLYSTLEKYFQESQKDKNSLSWWFYNLNIKDNSFNNDQLNLCLIKIRQVLKESPNRNELICILGILMNLNSLPKFREENKAIIITIEAQLFEYAKMQIHINKVDFEHGVVPILSYFGDTGYSKDHLSDLLNIIQQYFSYTETYQSEKELNLGFYHGQCGLLTVLMNVVQKHNSGKRIFNNVNEIAGIIEARIEQIVDNIIPVGDMAGLVTFFPESISMHDDIVTISNHLSWSQGDLNQALVLYKAGCFLNNPEYVKIADRVGTYTLIRKEFEDTEINSANLKDGSAGLAMMYLSLYKSTYNEKYLEGYEFWKDETLRMLNEALNNEIVFENTDDFLNGLLGIMLTLNAFEDGVKPQWLKLLLL